MISRIARAAMATAIVIAGTGFGSTLSTVSAETTGVGCDLKMGVEGIPPIDDGIEFYNFQVIRWSGTGFPPGSRVELHSAGNGFQDVAFFWDGVREDGTWDFVYGFGNPALPPTPVLFTALAEDDPKGCSDSVTGQFLGNVPVFDDIFDSLFLDEILWLHEAGVVAGCRPTLFCPRTFVTRAQIATFLVRALDLAPTENDHFTDDDGHKYEWSINRLAESGFTFGCGDGVFCPDLALTRAEMASLLVRALQLPMTDTDYFTDDEGSTHEANINALRESGIGTGCRSESPWRYCPIGWVTRGQMAAFLYRVMNR